MDQRGHSIQPEVQRPNRRLWAVLRVRLPRPKKPPPTTNRARRRVLLYRGLLFVETSRHGIKELFFEIGWGPTFGGEALHSEDCPEAPVGSPNLWFDAMAALTHATNYSGAIGTSSDTLHAV